jgi:nitrate reductase NapE component
MDKHITLVGVLNIVYRAWAALGGLVLLGLAAVFDELIFLLEKNRHFRYHDIPDVVFDVVPIILAGVGLLIVLVSVIGIIAGAGVLHRKEWGRILLLIISFFNLLRVPLGTLLGGYSLWVLMKDETIAIFSPPGQAAQP